MMTSQSDEGLVNEYFPLKGFGFIRRPKGRDVFFFYADLVDTDSLVDVGDRVSFDVAAGKKGPKAVNIKKLGSPN